MSHPHGAAKNKGGRPKGSLSGRRTTLTEKLPPYTLTPDQRAEFYRRGGIEWLRKALSRTTSA